VFRPLFEAVASLATQSLKTFEKWRQPRNEYGRHLVHAGFWQLFID